MISALIVNYRSWGFLEQAVRSLLEQQIDEPLEIVVVDNASPDRDAAHVARIEELLGDAGRLVLRDANGGYADGMLAALEAARGDTLLVSNPDVEYQPGCVRELRRALDSDARIGAVTPATFADRGLELQLPTEFPGLRSRADELTSLLGAGLLRRRLRRRVASSLRLWTAEQRQDVEMFPGWCFLMQRETVERIGFLDRHYPFYYEDTDLSLRARRAGLRILHVPDARLVHHYDRSASQEPDRVAAWRVESRRKFYSRWYGWRGVLVNGACDRLSGTATVRRRAAATTAAMPTAVELDLARDGAAVELPAPRRRFLIEICKDPLFQLAAGTLGSGSRWTPREPLRRALLAQAAEPIYLRAVDLDRSDLPELCRYRLVS